jgi:hypothetical protein
MTDKSPFDDSVHTCINAYITIDHDYVLAYPSRFTIHYSCISFIPTHEQMKQICYIPKIMYQITCVDSAAESGGSSRELGEGPTVTVVTVAC